jgi:transcriptional regulator with XRE-family HTH domain
MVYMFKTLRAQHNLSQQDVANATGLSPNYILKAEQLTFPIPSPVLADFYLKLDPTLDLDYLKSWYAQEQRTQRELWLTEYRPTLSRSWLFDGSFRHAWEHTETCEVPTQYALSKGLCISASVVYSLEHGARPYIVRTVLDQLIDFVESGRFETEVSFDHLDSDAALSGLLVLKEHFCD